MLIAVEDAFGYVESRGGNLLRYFTVSRLLGTDHRAVHRALKPLQDTSYVTSTSVSQLRRVRVLVVATRRPWEYKKLRFGP